MFALGAGLAALGGALQSPREPANLGVDLVAIGEAFVVVVVGGMGSIPGAFLAALLIAELKALCVAIGQVTLFGIELSFSKLTLVVEFLVMALVLIWRPQGLLGRPGAATRNAAEIEAPLKPADTRTRMLGAIALVLLLAVPAIGIVAPYTTVLAIDILVMVLFATSLHFIMGPGGMHSFGHAAYFGLGAFGAGLLVKQAGWPMEGALAAAPVVAGLGALVFGWFCVRLSGVYLAMLTLAFGQIVWSVAFQWDNFTGGSNGIVGVWPSAWLNEKWVYYYLTLALTLGGVLLLWRMLLSPFGYAMRASRDSPLRADAIGIDVFRTQWMGFVAAGTICGIAGGLFAFSKGSISPEVDRRRPIDRRLGDGPVGWHSDDERTGRGRSPVHLAAGPDCARVSVLACGARRNHSDAGAVVPARGGRDRSSCCSPAKATLWTRLHLHQANVMSLLTVAGLSKAFGGVRAVHDVSFEVAAGELVALIGPNGAGKSTCFNMLNGQLPADSGRIEFEGQSIAGLKPRQVWRRGVGRTFQITATFSSMTVRENVQMALLSYHRKLSDLWSRAGQQYCSEADALLERVGMAAQAERPCSVLAYGDLKRLELAVALANKPRLLLMDEPTAGMAPKERIELMALAASIVRSDRIGVLFTEHDMDVVFAHASRMIVLNRGEILASGVPLEVRADPQVQRIYLGNRH